MSNEIDNAMDELEAMLNDKINALTTERDTLRGEVELLKESRLVLAQMIIDSGSGRVAIKRAKDKEAAHSVLVNNQIYVSELLAKDRIKANHQAKPTEEQE